MLRKILCNVAVTVAFIGFILGAAWVIQIIHQNIDARSAKAAESKPLAATATFKGPVSAVGTMTGAILYSNGAPLAGTESEAKWRTFSFRREIQLARDKEPPGRCYQILMRLPGVEHVWFTSRYSLNIGIGEKFTWPEVLPAIEKALKKYGLEP